MGAGPRPRGLSMGPGPTPGRKVRTPNRVDRSYNHPFQVQLGSLFRQKPKSIAPSSLSLLYVEESSVDSLPIEPMEIKTVKVNF